MASKPAVYMDACCFIDMAKQVAGTGQDDDLNLLFVEREFHRLWLEIADNEGISIARKKTRLDSLSPEPISQVGQGDV